jgi:hypothetical protein
MILHRSKLVQKQTQPGVWGKENSS